ncbi:MAG: CheR family methyltransferase [Candidatus Accumulibacter sp. UW26]|jgi:chemotaxis protein methyltransferase CheR|uniref:Chemotaxis protein methyltransferase n=2 Tax=Candidatus Accumulibacter TaxID=327159 RepID=A0A080LR08_9PROT|nr:MULTISPECIES: CheR family methyltransferase [Candidatus Accumulibacter]KFB70557.1 MAG: Chemotaxis protein methyltransferase [Candidatus Accumulibacter phosphatis]MBL8408075.1 protein-glutamate O-methyltransferase CheR [Accumulibacter sp.]NMQ07676.1 protein-glutamate O-methyltransferase CheR [Candidatus Accumulibacter contiguus]HRE86742.1 CheR family methyltransferase [Accumulibacter sp.]
MALKRKSARPLEAIEADLLLLLLRERYGYDFSGYGRASLLRRLRQLVEIYQAGSLVELLPALLRDEQVAQMAINMLSVPVSEFFRDPPVWKYLREQVMPELDSFPRINVWQVGCGYGQESYSLAILLHECGLAYKARMITTDINADLLRVARRGRWPADQFAQWRANYLAAGGSACFDDYFVGNDHAGNETMAIRAESLQAMEFVEHNLVTDDAFLETQLLICRNVLIYFGAALQARALDLFERSLQRGGFLVLGSAESILGRDDTWAPLQAELRIFRKTMARAK